MPSNLHKLFHLVPGEGSKVLLFATLGALLQAGVAIGLASADSLFLAHLGVERLSLVYISMPIVMACFAPCLAVVQGKFGVPKTLYGTLVLIAVGGLSFGLTTKGAGESSVWLLFGMKLYTALWNISLYTLFWNFSDDFFSILDGKRVYGMIAAGSASGGMLGAAAVPWMTGFLSPDQLFMIWGLVSLGAIPVLYSVRRRYKPIETDDEESGGGTGTSELLHSVFSVFRSSRYALGLTAICFCGVHLSSVLEYLALGVLSEGKNASELAALLGKLYAIANGITLVTNLVLFNRIVGRLGVNNTVFILPLTYLAAFAFFYLNAGVMAALVAFYAYQSVLVAIDYNNINLLFNALPAAIKRQVRTFIEAMCEPLATALAGVFLLSRASVLGRENIALWGLCATLVALAASLLVKSDYVKALADNLRRDWLDFAQSTQRWRECFVQGDFALLSQKARAESPRVERFLAVDLMGIAGDPKTPETLFALVEDARPHDADRLRPAIRRLMMSQDPAVVARTLLWLEGKTAPEEPDLLDEFSVAGVLPVRHLHQWTQSRHPSRIAMAAVSRWYSSRLEDTQEAVAEVRALLQGDVAAQRWGVRALGTFRHSHHAPELRRFLNADDRDLRVETLRALHRIAGPDSAAVLEWVMPFVADAAADERTIILGIIQKIGDESAIPRLLAEAEQYSAAESRQLESLILDFGLKTIPGLTHVLRRTDVSSRSRCLAARALGRLAPPQLEMISEEVMANEVLLAESYVEAARILAGDKRTAESDGLTALRRYYHDRASESLEFILQLLSLAGRLPDFDLIKASLVFANPKDRANAIETIEQSCSRSLFDRLSPIIEATSPNAVAQGVKDGGRERLKRILERATQSRDPLECVAAHLASRDLGIAEARVWFDDTLTKAPQRRVAKELLALPVRTKLRDLEQESSEVLHWIERVAALSKAALFADARIGALDYLAVRGLSRFSPKGEVLFSKDNPCGAMMLVVQGEVKVISPIGERRVVAGHCINEHVLMGKIRREETAISQGCIALLLPSEVLTRAIKVFPVLGISLYRVKIVSAIA